MDIRGTSCRFLSSASANKMSANVAKDLLEGTPIKGMLGGGWHVSDRPPVMSGQLIVTQLGWLVILVSRSFRTARPGLGGRQDHLPVHRSVALRGALRLFAPERARVAATKGMLLPGIFSALEPNVATSNGALEKHDRVR